MKLRSLPTLPSLPSLPSFLLTLVLLLGALAISIYCLLAGSLPQQDGVLHLPQLSEPVLIKRDDRGIATFTGQSREAVAFATGYAHAQDRFFQMDLQRRRAAGELAELLGVEALEEDKEIRLHGFRRLAESVFAALPEPHQELLNAYTQGVNSGLEKLSVRPFEYLLLKASPRPWSAEDSLLVVWSLYVELQGHLEAREFARGWIRAHSSPEQLAFLLPSISHFDSPLDASVIDGRVAGPHHSVTQEVPEQSPDWMRDDNDQPSSRFLAQQERILSRIAVGSNSWAISGDVSRHGSAIVADDMHLKLRLAQIWYRSRFQFSGADGAIRDINGVTLPGMPNMVIGSNGHIAWGFTNAYADLLDLIELDIREVEGFLSYRDAGGQWRRLSEREERIRVAGGEDYSIRIRESEYGPLRYMDGRWYAIRWVAHQPYAVNMEATHLESATDLDTAIDIFNRAGIPAQNVLLAHKNGEIAWTLGGSLPNRIASLATTFPYPAAHVRDHWTQRLDAGAYPSVKNPVHQRLWSANSRHLVGEGNQVIGDGGSDLGARATQIRDHLFSLGNSLDESSLYQIGLDDRALFIDRWRKIALGSLSSAANRPEDDNYASRQHFRELLQRSWTAHADPDSIGYRLARRFYFQMYLNLFGDLDVQLNTAWEGADFDLANPRWPVVVERLLTERPAAWLPEGMDWDQFVLQAIDDASDYLIWKTGSLENATWGNRNQSRIYHPLARSLPFSLNLLQAPHRPQAGDDHMPRVAAPGFGQSQRMVVAPGKEEDGIFNMPGGQSGHPLSPYFLAGHNDWVAARPTPLLPGETRHILVLSP